MKLWQLFLAAVCALVVWYALAENLEKTRKGKTAFRVLSGLMAVLAVYGIFAYTVLNRNTRGMHQFVLVSQNNHEFLRELFMNGLLFLPLGLALSVFLGEWTILVAFLISTGIEVWQFAAGTGLAQGTDVLMNTVGATIGTIPLWIIRSGKVGHLAHRKRRDINNKEKE